MPKFDTVNSVSVSCTGNYSFSGVRPDPKLLTELEYTLATLIVDTSGSVGGFRNELLNAVRVAVESCRNSPKPENLLVRLVEFNTSVGIREIHGFLPLKDIDTAQYSPFQPSGGTQLLDAVYHSVDASHKYAKLLDDQDYIVNAVVFIVTDGEDNSSKFGPVQVKQMIGQAIQDEYLESIQTILIGINAGYSSAYLQRIQTDLGLTQYIDVANADAKSLAKLAAFISKSISSTSQALGTGGPSQSLTF